VLLLAACYPTVGSLPIQSTSVSDAAWKTFRADSGFEISYPLAYYSIRTGISGPEVLFPGVKVLEPDDAFSFQEPLAVTYRISLAASENTQHRSLNSPEQLLANGQLITYDPGLLTGKSIRKISVAGVDAVRVDDLPIGSAGITTQIATVCNDRVYELLVEPYQLTGNQAEPYREGQPTKTNRDLVEKIIATFKLVDCKP
jgi:hypothetical protein